MPFKNTNNNTTAKEVTNMEMSKTYNPQEFEEKLYENWLKIGCFEAKVDKKK